MTQDNKARMYLYDQGVIYIPATAITDEQAHRVYTAIEAWTTGTRPILVLPEPTDIIDTRRNRRDR